MMDVIVFSILGYVFPFYPCNNPKNEKFKTMKKRLADIILHNCIKNNDHMLYCSWDIARVGCNCYFHFGQFLALLTLTTAQKMKIFKKWKVHLEVSSFNKSLPKISIICYAAPEIWHVADVIVIFYFRLFLHLRGVPLTAWKKKFKKMKRKKTPGYIILHECTKNHDHMLYYSWDMVHDRCNYFLFWAAFCPFTISQTKKWNFLKSDKNAWIYHHLTHLHQKLWLDDVRFLRYGVRWTDGRTDERKKWHVEVGAPHKKKINISNRVHVSLG